MCLVFVFVFVFFFLEMGIVIELYVKVLDGPV